MRCKIQSKTSFPREREYKSITLINIDSCLDFHLYVKAFFKQDLKKYLHLTKKLYTMPILL